jgi:hypothetical protein
MDHIKEKDLRAELEQRFEVDQEARRAVQALFDRSSTPGMLPVRGMPACQGPGDHGPPRGHRCRQHRLNKGRSGSLRLAGPPAGGRSQGTSPGSSSSTPTAILPSRHKPWIVAIDVIYDPERLAEINATLD